jgi:hypothetical protein
VPTRLARESGGGFGATAQELASEFLRWIDMPQRERAERGEQSHRYGREHFSFDAAVDALESVLLEAAVASRR